MIVKARNLAGFDAVYVPGWDCHGMPIEIQIEKQFGKSLPAAEVRQKARAYASEQIEKQKAGFRRLGVLGDWDNPYKTMNFVNEAGEIRALAKILEKGYVFRGLKPVNWCFDCGSALAEAEVEYKDKTDPTIDVTVRLRGTGKDRAGLRPCRAAEGGRRHRHLDDDALDHSRQPGAQRASRRSSYSLVDTSRGLLILAEERVEECLKNYGLTGTTLATAKGEKLANLRFHHPLASAHPGYKRTAPVYLGDYVTTESGTGIVHSSPAYGVEDFVSCKAHGMADSRHHQSGHGRRPLYRIAAALWRAVDLEGESARSSKCCAETKSLLKSEKYTHSYMHCWRHKTPIIYRATSQWFARHGREAERQRENPARNRAGRHRGDRVLSVVGQAASATA